MIGTELSNAMNMLNTSNPDGVAQIFKVPPLPPHWNRKLYPKPQKLSRESVQKALEDHDRERDDVIARVRSTARTLASDRRIGTAAANTRLLQVALLNAVRCHRKHGRDYNEILLTGDLDSMAKQRATILTRIDFLPLSDEDRHDIVLLISYRNFDA